MAVRPQPHRLELNGHIVNVEELIERLRLIVENADEMFEMLFKDLDIVGTDTIEDAIDAHLPWEVTEGGTGADNAADARTNLDAQQQDEDLDAIAALVTTGLLARTGSATYATRTLTNGGGILITNGDGVSGNPTLEVDASGGYWAPVTNGDPTWPEVIFDASGECLMAFVSV